MDLDFLEIGTSNFGTLLQEASDETIGISVEPIKYYLDTLPDKKNVIKANTAITSGRTSNIVEIYYIPENIVDKNNLGWWIKGCNRINEYHPLHIEHNLQKYVTIEKVPLINIDEFLIQYNIKSIKYLKIDTEGHDAIILNGLFDYLENKPTTYYPQNIMFESNANINTNTIDLLIKRALYFGYKLVSKDEENTVLIKQ